MAPKLIKIKSIETSAEVLWLAGLLEAEGCFYSHKIGIQLLLVMTDKEIICRVGEMMNAKVYTRRKKAPRKTAYGIVLIGKRAAFYMQAILPHMGQRRSAGIRALLEMYYKKGKEGRAHLQRKSNVPAEAMIAAWNSRPSGQSQAAFARSIGMNPKTVRGRLGKLGLVGKKTKREYVGPKYLDFGAVQLAGQEPINWNLSQAGYTEDQAAWLAGILEGDGYLYLKRKENHLYIQLASKDIDVIARYCDLTGAAYVFHALKGNRAPAMSAHLSGPAALTVMRAIFPFMGAKQRAKLSGYMAYYKAHVHRYPTTDEGILIETKREYRICESCGRQFLITRKSRHQTCVTCYWNVRIKQLEIEGEHQMKKGRNRKVSMQRAGGSEQ